MYKDQHPQLLKSAALAVLQNPRLSMAALAGQLKIGRATLNRQFSSRDMLLAEVGRFAIEQSRACFETARSRQADPRVALQGLIADLAREPALYWYLCSTTDPETRQRWAAERQWLVELFQRGQDGKVFTGRLPAEWMAEAFNALMCSAARAVVEQRMNGAELAGRVALTLQQGLLAD